VNIEANVVGSHRAVLPVRRMIRAPYGMTLWRTANLIAVSGGPPRVFIDTCFWQRAMATALEMSAVIAGGGALSRLKHGFESRWGHQVNFLDDFAPRISIPPCRDLKP